MTVVLAALASAILFYFSQGLDEAYALAWFAPVPLLWVAYGSTPRWQVLIACLTAFGAGQIYLVQCYAGLLPPFALVPLVGVMSVAFAGAVLFSGVIFHRGSAWLALLAFPALWTAIEYFIGIVSPHGSYGALGYAEVSFPPGIQIAALLGLHAVAFVLCLSANSVALILRHRWQAGVVGMASCALVLVFGLVRLAEPEGPRIRVAALADADTWHAESREHTFAAEQAATQAYARYIGTLSGVRVVAIPEGSIRMRDSDTQAVLAPLGGAARASGALIVAGTFVPEPAQNRAFAFFPDGAVRIYAKRHLLIPLEMGIPGRDPGILGSGYATQICKDMDFAATVRSTAAHDVRLMIVPANDFGRDGWIHARIAVMRGVENGFAVLRSAFNGVETITDAQGRILAIAPTDRTSMVAITADVPLGPGPTLYTRLGDVFPWLCVALSLFAGMHVVRHGRKLATARGVVASV